MLLYARRVECIRYASGREDQVIIFDLEVLIADLVIIVEGWRAGNGLRREIDIIDVGFQKIAFSRFAPHGLLGEIEIEETAGSGGE